MRHLLVSAMWTMMAGIVIVPIADHILARRSTRFHYDRNRSAFDNHEDWIKWWQMEHHPANPISAKRGPRKK